MVSQFRSAATQTKKHLTVLENFSSQLKKTITKNQHTLELHSCPSLHRLLRESKHLTPRVVPCVKDAQPEAHSCQPNLVTHHLHRVQNGRARNVNRAQPRSGGAIKAGWNRAVWVQQEDASDAVPALEEDSPPRAEMRGFPLNNVCQCGLFTLLLVFSFMPLTTAVSFDLTELRNKVAKIKVNPRGNLWATGEHNLHPN